MTVLIAGGGIAGAAAACLLGPAATVFEREAGAHDKVCGEFVSWEAQDALARLGLDPASLGGAAIKAVRLVHGTSVATARLPATGLGLSRRALDEALLALAARRGARILRGHAVRRLTGDGLEVDGIGHVQGRVLLATGKHALRGARRPEPGEALIGLKTYYRLDREQDAALAGHVEVMLFAGGYAGLQHVECGRANLCLLIARRAFTEAGATWSGVLAHLHRHAPHLARRLHGATALLDRPVSIARIPYGFVHPGGGPARLGDQMGVIPSFSGDGMAIALHTACAAAAQPEAARYHAAMRADLSGQIGRAMVLHRMGRRHPAVLAAAARAWPGALAWIARLTRVAALANPTPLPSVDVT